MSKGFWRFCFWFNLFAITGFLYKRLILCQYIPPTEYVLCGFNACFTILYIWDRCEFDTTWYDDLVRQIKWRYKKWKSKRQ